MQILTKDNPLRRGNPVIINQLKRILKPLGFNYCYGINRFMHKSKHGFSIMPDLHFHGYWRVQYFRQNLENGKELPIRITENLTRFDLKASNVYDLLEKLVKHQLISL